MSARLEKKLEKATQALGSGRRLEAERLYRSVLAEEPNHPSALSHMGLLQGGLGLRRDAALSLGRALSLDPSLHLGEEFADILLDLSLVYRNGGRPDAALEVARRAVIADEKSARTHSVLSTLLTDAWRLDEAVASARRAVELEPGFADGHFRLGAAIFGRGEVEEALASFRRTLELEPSHAIAHSNLVFGMAYAPDYDARSIAEQARSWARRHADPLAARAEPHENVPDPERRLRIGYVSADFRSHPSAHFTLPLVEGHDRSAFEVVCYSSVNRPDAVTERTRRSADRFRDVAGITDEALALSVRKDGIDVLVDLSLHSGGHRLLAFARRPAPVQVAYLAYLGTTGLAEMDYRFTAPLLDASDTDPPDLYAEAPLHLPDTYWCYDPLEEGAPTAGSASRPEPGETAGLRFGSLNSFHKQSDETLVLWARVLRAAPASHFVVHAPPEAAPRVLAAFGREGVAAERVTVLPRRPRAEYLATLGTIDLCLDTIPYNGATTTLDGLWVGTPTLTLVGRTAVGRAGLHISMNVGMPELVTRSHDEFVKRAIELTGDRERLRALKASLRARLRASTLMDAPRFVGHVEARYREAFRAWCARRGDPG